MYVCVYIYIYIYVCIYIYIYIYIYIWGRQPQWAARATGQPGEPEAAMSRQLGGQKPTLDAGQPARSVGSSLGGGAASTSERPLPASADFSYD